MAKEDYDDILDRSFDEADTSKLLPKGPWLLRGKNARYMPPKEEGKSGKVLFFLTVKEPTDGVDEEAISELGEDYDYNENELSYTVWIEKGRDWKRVNGVLTKAGIDTSEGTIRDNLKKFDGVSLIGDVDVRTYENSMGEEITENTITAFYAVEE